jgi:CHRD domain-containing protein/PEP-CTERM motif-containing protein
MARRGGLIIMGVLIALSMSVRIANATPITFVATLSGASEIPPDASTATGFVLAVLDPVAQTLQLSILFSNLGSPDTAAHIHCCLVSPFALVNVGVATTVPAFPGFPLGVMSGTYSSVVFDLTQSSIYNPAFVTAQGGLLQAEAAFVAGILNGETYLNIHTTQFPGGEIRGFLVPVPEPASIFLLGSGLVGLLGRRRAEPACPK